MDEARREPGLPQPRDAAARRRSTWRARLGETTDRPRERDWRTCPASRKARRAAEKRDHEVQLLRAGSPRGPSPYRARDERAAGQLRRLPRSLAAIPSRLGRIVERRRQAVARRAAARPRGPTRERTRISPAIPPRRSAAPSSGFATAKRSAPSRARRAADRHRAVAVGVRLDHGVDASGARRDSRGSGSWTRSRPDRRPPEREVESRESRVESSRGADSLVFAGFRTLDP